MKTAIIYKIELDNEIYVGSTEQKLCSRQSRHNSDLKIYPYRTLYQKCIELDIEKIKCIWVADIKFNSTAEKRAIEEKYRKDLNAVLNMRKCYTTKEERREQKRKANNTYYHKNSKELLEKYKEYHKKYREDHKEQIKAYHKKRYENTK